MVCRERYRPSTPFISIARRLGYLTDAQANSVFHALLREGRALNLTPPTREEFNQLIDAQLEIIDTSPAFSDNRRINLHQRLNELRDTAELPPPEYMYAFQNACSRVAETNPYDVLAQRTSLSQNEVGSRVRDIIRMRNRATREQRRAMVAPSGYEAAIPPGAPRDSGSLWAQYYLECEAGLREPDGILRCENCGRFVSLTAAHTCETATTPQFTRRRRTTHSRAVREVGYNSETNELDVVYATSPHRVYRYANVPPEVYDDIERSNHPGRLIGTLRSEYSYDVLTATTTGVFPPPPGESPELDVHSYATSTGTLMLPRLYREGFYADEAPLPESYLERIEGRCARCGRFVGVGSAHNCPTPNVVGLLEGDQEVLAIHEGLSISVPSIESINRALSLAPSVIIETEINDDHDEMSPGHLGILLVRDSDGHKELLPAQSHLACCSSYPRCEHFSHARDALANVIDDLNPTQLTPDLAAEYEDALTSRRRTYQDARGVSQNVWESNYNSSIRFAEDMAAFQYHYDAAKSKKEEALSSLMALSYEYDNVTAGMGSAEAGRSFGIEIEFIHPYGESGAADVTRALYRAGLASSSSVQHYHQSQAGGYSSPLYTVERDATVSGEIVSPILYDTRETWERLEELCRILKEEGAYANFNAGAHVTVSTGDFDEDVSAYRRIAQSAYVYEDVLYRFAQNPRATSHRGTRYCTPLSGDPEAINNLRGYNSLATMQRLGNHQMINFTKVLRSGRREAIEYRLWDGSLDPSVMQAQVKLSLALTDAGLRGVEPPPVTESKKLGFHKDLSRTLRAGARTLSGDNWETITSQTRQFLDTYLPKDVDKEQMVHLFAYTNWGGR